MVYDTKHFKKILWEKSLPEFARDLEKEIRETGLTTFFTLMRDRCNELIAETDKKISKRAGYKQKVAVYDKLFNDAYIKGKEPIESITLITEYPLIDLQSLQGLLIQALNHNEMLRNYNTKKVSKIAKTQFALGIYHRLYEDVKKMLRRAYFALVLKNKLDTTKTKHWKDKISILRNDKEINDTLTGFVPVIRNAVAHHDYKISEKKGTILLRDESRETEYTIQEFTRKLNELIELYFALCMSQFKIGAKYYELVIPLLGSFEELVASIDKDEKEKLDRLLKGSNDSVLVTVMENLGYIKPTK